jgi:ribosomal small subunit protein bTHX
MGKGDRRTEKGKRWAGSHGNVRKRKDQKTKVVISTTKSAKTPAKASTTKKK